MIDWQITAITIYCDAVDDEVTLLVYKDTSVKCTGHQKYDTLDKEAARQLKRKSKQLKRQLRCEGLECYRMLQYRDKVLVDEDRGSK